MMIFSEWAKEYRDYIKQSEDQMNDRLLAFDKRISSYIRGKALLLDKRTHGGEGDVCALSRLFWDRKIEPDRELETLLWARQHLLDELERK